MEPHINCQEFQFYVYKICDNVVFFCKVYQNVRKQQSEKMANLKNALKLKNKQLNYIMLSGYV